MIKENHEHVWERNPSYENVLGFFTKRGDGTDADWYRGSVYSCSEITCNVYFFIPNWKSFGPVEVIMATSKEIKKAKKAYEKKSKLSHR